jgi:translation elongation factor EF-Ts
MDVKKKFGTIAIYYNAVRTIIFEINTETELVLHNTEFENFVINIGRCFLSSFPENLEKAYNIPYIDLKKSVKINVERALLDLSSMLGENIIFKRYQGIERKHFPKLKKYCYSGLYHYVEEPKKLIDFSEICGDGEGKIGTIVELLAIPDDEFYGTEKYKTILRDLGNDLAKKIAVQNPVDLDQEISIINRIKQSEKELNGREIKILSRTRFEVGEET